MSITNETINTISDKEVDEQCFYSKRTSLPIGYYTHIYNNSRRSRVIVIGCCMRKYLPFCSLNKDLQEKYIRKIERSCYNYTCTSANKNNVPRNWKNKNFKTLYNIITYRIQKNLVYDKDDPGSEYLINEITEGRFPVHSIGKMKSNELRPEKTKKIYEEIKKRKQQKVVKRYSTQHECFKCKGRKTTEVEIQIMCLDEGSTLIVTCEMDNCANVWRLNS
jgi:DNA-directed RNA polymerase subunit M/transcription elongation factor TFIIS